MTYRIDHVGASEILDSRGRPTLEVVVRLSDGTTASAGVGESRPEHRRAHGRRSSSGTEIPPAMAALASSPQLAMSTARLPASSPAVPGQVCMTSTRR